MGVYTTKAAGNPQLFLFFDAKIWYDMRIPDMIGGVTVGNMDEDTKVLYNSLIKLRDMTKNDRLECCDEVLRLLNYKKEKNKDKEKEKEKEIKSYQFDAFLVKAVDECFKKSRDADIALMAFGLLQGYEYDKIVITERRYKYLEESDYLMHNPRSRIKVFADANEKEKEGLGERLRKGRENTCIKKLAEFLLGQGAMQKFVDEIDDYILESIDGEPFAKLSELNYRRDAYTAQESTKNTDTIDKPENNDAPPKISDVKDEDLCSADKTIDEDADVQEDATMHEAYTPEDIPTMEPDDNPIGKEPQADAEPRREPPPSPPDTHSKTYIKIPKRFTIPTSIVGIIFIVSMMALVIIVYHHIVTPPQIEEIDVKTEVSVNPGEKKDLELDIKPDQADQKKLKYKIGNEELVEITLDWWAVGLDGLGDAESDSTTILIWGGKAEPAVINVTVEKPGSRGNAPIWEDYSE